MPVIKGQNAAALIKDAIVLDLGDLEHQAKRIREQAERRAQEIVEEAKQRAGELETDLKQRVEQAVAEADQRGYEQGLARGEQEGRDQGTQAARDEIIATFQPQVESLTAGWSAALDEFSTARTALHRDARRAVVEFALKLAQKVVHRAIEVDPGVVVDQVTDALAHVLRPMDVTVRIHPDDRPIIEQSMPELAASFRAIEEVDWQDDASLDRGGCVVSYGQGRVDASIATQLDRIVSQILPPTSNATAAPGSDLSDDTPNDEAAPGDESA